MTKDETKREKRGHSSNVTERKRMGASTWVKPKECEKRKGCGGIKILQKT